MNSSKPLFILVISGTDTIKHPGISAAGASQEMLKYTAALDAEFIYHGQTKTLDQLPASPNGIVSPALISKACLSLLGIPSVIIDAGAHIKPQCPYIQVRYQPAADISTGKAMTRNDVLELILTGNELAEEFSKFDKLIIAECVVGGTTTALGLLSAMGYDCAGMVSSSFPNGNHALKREIIEQGLANRPASSNKDAIQDLAAMGDPSQALIAGLVQGSKQEVTLAGGTQMLAIAALIKSLGKKAQFSISPSPWVIKDQSAKFFELHQLVCPEIEIKSQGLKACQSLELEDKVKELSGLELKDIFARYNEGHVKEGVGMGALLTELNTWVLDNLTLCAKNF
ncbi:MAG: TIGR00303 family protein [Candidatus Melainabacteria bacterium]|jgi:uncharacterized protein (TIGR00303 family)|nr:TIGR00303 family protein [Candidatus Melainabacteria bacterium]